MWRERRSIDERESQVWLSFWIVSAGVLLVMAFGRLIDLDRFVIELGRTHARSDGWYGARLVQMALVGATMTLGVALAIIGLRRVDTYEIAMWVALRVSALVVFAAIRIVSLHWTDAAMSRRVVGDVRASSLVELGLAAFTVANVWRRCTLAGSRAHLNC